METKPGEYGQPRDEHELGAVADNIAQAFAMSPTDAMTLAQRVGTADYRVLRDGGKVTASLSFIHMGQWLGGRSVPMVGVGSVGVSPMHRGGGTATRLMQAVLRETREAGVPLSVLYPATQPLYRRVGYELAGARYEIRVQAAALELGERSLSLRAVEPQDEPALSACYHGFARQRHGWLDRGRFIWSRVRAPRNDTAYGFLVEGNAGVEGYVYLTRKAVHGLRQELFLTDFVATSPVAARRLLRFLGDHRSLAQEVVWMGGPMDPVLMLLREQSYQVKLFMHWMVRLVNVPAALEARGWAPGVSGALHLEVDDDLFPENRGRFVLEVSDGGARVRQGGDGRMRLHVRGLASLYTGFLTAEALALTGALEADEASLRLASALFAGPPPAMPDMF